MSRLAWLILLLACAAPAAFADAEEHRRDRWVEIAPPARAEHACVYDAGHRRLIIFGGQADGGLRNDVWVLSLSGRSSLPHGDRGDDDRAAVERGAQSSDREIWRHLDHPRWDRIEPAGEPPSPRSGAAAAYDAACDRLLVFGGRDTSGQALDDLWELSLRGRGDRATWRQVAIAGSRPQGRYRATLTLDPEEGGLVLYGGEPWYGWKLSDVWMLSLPELHWRRINPSGDPPAGRSAHSAVYCPDLHGILIFGGESYGVPGCPYCVGSRENAEILLLRLGDQPTWSALAATSAEGPCEMQGHLAAWDEAGHRMLVFGGGNFWRACAVSYATVWSLSVPGLAWSRLGPAQPWPRPRPFAAAFFDPASRDLYVHGGEGGVGGGACYADAWRLALDPEPTWTLLEPEQVTPHFQTTWQLPAVYHRRADRVLVDGGDRVWAYDVESAAWSPIVTSGDAPPVHLSSSAVLDMRRDRLVVYGGALPASPPYYRHAPFQEVWTLSLGDDARWTRLPTTGQAPVAGTGAAIYDPVRDRLLVYASGVWALPFGAAGALQWQQISSPSDTVHVRTPTAQSAVVVYDSRRDRMVVFGGGFSTPIDLQVYTVNSCAALDLNGPPVWNQLSPDPRHPALPTPRALASGIYDAAGDRLIVVGGFEHSVFISHIPDDAWALALNSDKWNPLRMETDPHPGWMNSTAVYDSRRDRTLVLQNDIIWALESGSGERHHGPREDAVERQNQAPGPVVLDLRGACPNPSAGAILAQFTLPDASPASLELLDVAGRRLWTEDVGELGGGSHVVQVNPARTLTPGLYLLRLTRGSTSLTRKVIRLGRFER